MEDLHEETKRRVVSLIKCSTCYVVRGMNSMSRCTPFIWSRVTFGAGHDNALGTKLRFSTAFHLQADELAYIGMTPFEAFHGRRCRMPSTGVRDWGQGFPKTIIMEGSDQVWKERKTKSKTPRMSSKNNLSKCKKALSTRKGLYTCWTEKNRY
ncbi:putative retroelement [Cucumis melo var. makuwa]|uniref:Retroelement n=1 Tax=Cucumis melo var. makuwa TaxID=1194695 RepID=A0A5A7SM28_CUCMM|nr:putative retroelement [Cucumis melo var. makuwa]